MPMSEPLKVSISPKAIRIEWWISPKGGQRKPANNSPHPNPHSIIATINWKFFFMISLSFSPRGPHEIRDLVGRAEALSALTTTVGQCTKLPNARTKMHNAIASINWKYFILTSQPRLARRHNREGSCTWSGSWSLIDRQESFVDPSYDR